MKFENTVVYGFESAIHGMRNPLQSWDKSDTIKSNAKPENSAQAEKIIIGEKDLELAKRLIIAGDSDAKFLRQISVWSQITAPSYWFNEQVQYKVGTVSNSTSLMHTGVKREFTIDDFEVGDDRVYDILSPQRIYEKSCHNIEKFPIVYPYETDDWKPYQVGTRQYKVFRNGRVIACEFIHEDNGGRNGGHRTRLIKEHECSPYQSGRQECYVTVHLGGHSVTNNNKFLHRVVAEAWGLPKPDDKNEYFIDHKDGNKGNNCLENLEWVTRSENERRKQARQYNPWRKLYLAYKNNKKFNKEQRKQILDEHKQGVTYKELCEKYNTSVTLLTAMNNPVKYYKNYELFSYCEYWENLLECLNSLRASYLETKDESYFYALRSLIPMGYKYTVMWSGNYMVLRNMYRQRKHHRLPEWSVDFINWIKSLPYSELITCGLDNIDDKIDEKTDTEADIC